MSYNKESFEWDAFISHATEDKESFVRELADSLVNKGIRVWYDEFTLCVGDSLRRSIEKGLTKSRYGIVILSHSFFKKEWPQKELDGLVERERNGEKVILPVWLDVDKDDVTKYSPMLSGRVATKVKDGMDKVVVELLRVLKPKPSDMVVSVAENESLAIINKMTSTSTKLTKYKKYLPNTGQLKSTVFFNERVSKAFPGIRGLHIISNSEEAVNRLCTLLHAPLEFKEYSPIWMIFRQGSREINDCKGINGSHILIEPYELNIRKLAVYRGRVYWQDFVYIECAADKPTGIYPHLTKEYINQFLEDTEMVSYTEEYAIWKDQLLTREQYDDGAIFRNGGGISTTGARLRCRYLTPANIIIAAQLSPIHDLSFDRPRKECFDQLLQGQMSLEEFVAVIKYLPKHMRE